MLIRSQTKVSVAFDVTLCAKQIYEILKFALSFGAQEVLELNR